MNEKNILPMIAYYYAKKVQSELTKEKKDRNKNFSNLILQHVNKGIQELKMYEFYLDYLYANIDEVSLAENFKVYLLSREDYVGEGSFEDCIRIAEFEEETITEHMTSVLYEDIKKMAIPTISSLDVNSKLDTGIYHINFGDQKLTMFIDGEDAVLFSLKLPEDRDSVKYTLLPKEDMIKALTEVSKKFKDMIKEATKEGNYWEILSEILNSFVSKDVLTVKYGTPSLTVKRGKAVDKDIALDNLLDVAPPFWKTVIEDFERDPNPSTVKAFSSKMGKILEKGELPDNDFVSIQKGRTSLDNVDEYITTLEDENLDLADVLTKGDSEKISITIASIVKTEVIAKPDESLIGLLESKYKDKIKYRAEIKVKESDNKSIYFQDTFRTVLK